MAQMQELTTLDFQILHAIQRIFSCSVLDFLMPHAVKKSIEKTIIVIKIFL